MKNLFLSKMISVTFSRRYWSCIIHFPVDSYIIALFHIFSLLSPYLFSPFNSCKFSILYYPAPLFIYLTLNLLTTTIVSPPSNASKWQMGFNSAFKGLIITILNFVISLFPSHFPLSISIYLFCTSLYLLLFFCCSFCLRIVIFLLQISSFLNN